MGHDYRGFQDKMMGDISQATAVAQSQNRAGKGGNKLRLKHSDVEPLVPSNSVIEYANVPAHKLKFGDIVIIRQGTEVVLRRFAGMNIGRGGTLVKLACPQQKTVEQVSDTSITGKVTGVEVGGKMTNPYKKESWSHWIVNRFTCFGCSTPKGQLEAGLKSAGDAVSRKGGR